MGATWQTVRLPSVKGATEDKCVVESYVPVDGMFHQVYMFTVLYKQLLLGMSELILLI